MNLKKFIRTNRLFLAALLFLIVIIAILLSLRVPTVTYRVNPDKVSAMLAESGNQMSPLSLFGLLSKNPTGIVVVDIRSSDEYSKGHIENALNIPVKELLQNRSVTFFQELEKSSTPAILYGNDQLQANGPWLLLQQLGIENVKVLQGGYAFYKTLPLADSLLQKSEFEWNVELTRIDTSEYLKVGNEKVVAASSENSARKTPEKVVPVKKPVSGGGGC